MSAQETVSGGLIPSSSAKITPQIQSSEFALEREPTRNAGTSRMLESGEPCITSLVTVCQAY